MDKPILVVLFSPVSLINGLVSRKISTGNHGAIKFLGALTCFNCSRLSDFPTNPWCFTKAVIALLGFGSHLFLSTSNAAPAAGLDIGREDRV